ncbi:MAG TPA: FG-GAP-like repeat-containing protein [Pyrinomonadaceae bacterium]
MNLRTSKFSASFITLLLVVFFVCAAKGASGDIDTAFNVSVTDGSGYVNKTLAQSDGKIIVLGSFQKANGVRYANIARFNADGTLDAAFNAGGSGANNSIFFAAFQADGKILIGGSFTAFNGQTANRLTRLNANGSLDASFNLAANFNAAVNAIVIQPDGKILVGGAFNAPPGQPLLSRIVRLNTDGSVDSSFINNASINSDIYAIAYSPDGKILIGGNFTAVGATQVGRIARLNGDGSFDATFNPAAGANDWVSEIIVQSDGKILVGGMFNYFNQTFTSGGLVRLNADGSLATTFALITDLNTPTVESLALQPDGKVLAAIFNPDFAPNMSVARFNADGTQDTNFNVAVPYPSLVRDVNILANGKLIISGDFVAYGSETHLRVARINTDGTVDSSFNPAVSTMGIVRVIKQQANGKILVGGDFEFVNGVRKSSLVRLNPDGSIDASFNSPADYFGNVYDIDLLPDGKMIIGGSYASSSIFGFGQIFRLNADGSLDNFSVFETYSSSASFVVQPDGKIVGGGSFGIGSLIRVSSNGDEDSTFNPVQPTGGLIRELLLQPDGGILVGGAFTFPRVGTAKYKTDGSLDQNYTATIPNVYALGLASGGKVYAGGNFDINGGNANRNLTRLNADGSNDSGFINGTGPNALVRDLFVQTNGKILIGGDFTTYNGNAASRVARVNSDGSFDSTFNTGAGASGSVYALETQSDGKVLVGGQFLDFGGTEKLSLVRLQNASSRTSFDFDGDGKSDISVYRASEGVWYLQKSTEGFAAARWGTSIDFIAPADFDGDGKTDIAVFRNGDWYVSRSSDNAVVVTHFGNFGDYPRPADYDGDGRADFAVYRTHDKTWYLLQSRDGFSARQFGLPEDKPIVADFDGDGKSDIAVFRQEDGNWYWLNSSNGQSNSAHFGANFDLPVAADYDGDGKTDLAVFRPIEGNWYFLYSSNGQFSAVRWGVNNDLPAPADYDGDGKADITVFRPSTGEWYLLKSTQGFQIVRFGVNFDQPIPNAFIQ